MEKGEEINDALQAPLLPRALLTEGCPGCLLEQRKAAAHGAPPKKELFFVAVISLANSLPIASLFPFVYFMVRDFGIAKSETRIGSYAGLIGSAMMLGRFMTSTFWGMVADKYGRKPVILVGTSSIILFNTMFGFSPNFWVALTTRFFLGACNGMLGAIRAYASEICSKENQAWGISMVGTMWGLGLVIGPAIGGYLAQPSTQYPTLFPSGSLFDKFPYALPCICISMFSIPALLAGYWIPESIHNHETGVTADELKLQEYGSVNRADPEARKRETAVDKVVENELSRNKKLLWNNMALLVGMYIYCVWGLHTMAYSEIFSLWCVSPTSYGGLGFTTSDVGNTLSITGVALLVFQLFVSARLTKMFGALGIVQEAGAITVILTALYPLIAKLRGTTLWTVLIAASMTKSLLSACVNIGASILINNSVTSEQRGTANGMSTSIMSLFKAIGPSTAGIIFSWGQERVDASFLPALPIASLFPFVYFMVRDFGIAKVETQIGSYAGLLGSALMLGRFMTSTFWGMFADNYGRKPVILFGTTSIILFNTLFGFSPNFWVALTTRFLLGACNGMLGAIRAYASEICSKENQAWGISMVETMWGLGLVIGPAIGGYLAQPSTQYSTLFPSGSLFDKFPYALPCICISVFSIPALLSSYWIPESLHSHEIGDDTKFQEDDTINSVDPGVGKRDTALVKIPETELPASIKLLWKNMETVGAMYIFCVWGLHAMAYSEIFSLWCVSPTSYGGLGFTTSDVGNVLSITGVALLVFQLFVSARLTNVFGALGIVQGAGVLTVILTALYPLIAKLSGTTLWTVLISASMAKNLLSACVNIGSTILINNSVTSKQRGIVNGVSTSIMSLFKAIGPSASGLIFSWGQERVDASFLPGMWMVFSLLSFFAIIALIPAFRGIFPCSQQPKDCEF